MHDMSSHSDVAYLRHVRTNTKDDIRVCRFGCPRKPRRRHYSGHTAPRDHPYVNSYCAWIAHLNYVDTNNPADGVYICADGDPPGDHRLAYSWLPVLVTEAILLGLTLYRGWQDRRQGYGTSTFLRILTRDSVIYFMAYVEQLFRHCGFS